VRDDEQVLDRVMRRSETQRNKEIDAAHTGRAQAKVWIAMLGMPEGHTKELLTEAHRLLDSARWSKWKHRPHCSECGAPASPEVEIGCLDCRS